MSLLGLDIGTSGCKAVVFSEAGLRLAQAAAEYPLLASPDGHFELDAEEVWRHAAACIRRVNAEVEDDPVIALAVSVLGEAVVPVGRDGIALAPSPVSFDGRAGKQAQAFARTFGAERVYRLTGQPIHPMYSLQKIAWWREHDPALFARVWKFLCFGDFALLKMGLEPAIDYSMAARTQAFDVTGRRWADDLLAWAGIGPAHLAAPVPGGTVIGRLPEATARTLGFRGPVVAAAGGHDQACGALGSGALGVGECMYALGTTAVLAPTLMQPSAGLAKDGFPVYPHVLPDRWITLAGTPSGGSLLRWFRDTFGDRELQTAQETGRSVYEVMLEEVQDAPGRLLLLPHFAGTEAPHHNPEARGALFGLTLHTTRADIVQALVEGIAFEMADYASRLRAAGVALTTLRAIGGGARSPRWMQMHAHMLNLPVAVPRVTEAAALGAALLAGWGSGCYDSLQQAVERTVTVADVYRPDADRAAQYAQCLDLYRRLYPAAADIHTRM